jgi:hypothetical protein
MAIFAAIGNSILQTVLMISALNGKKLRTALENNKLRIKYKNYFSDQKDPRDPHLTFSI